MPTDVLSAIRRRQINGACAAWEEVFILLVPALLAVFTMAVSICNPLFAATIVYVGLQ